MIRPPKFMLILNIKLLLGIIVKASFMKKIVAYYESDLINFIDSLNLDSNIHGILVQLPLPKHLDEKI